MDDHHNENNNQSNDANEAANGGPKRISGFPILSPFDLKLPEEQQAVLNQIANILSTAALKLARKERRKIRPTNFDAKE